MKKIIISVLISIASLSAFSQGTNVYSFFFNYVQSGFKYPLIGFINTANGEYAGLQLGFINTNRGAFAGAQIGFVNTVTDSVRGAQVGFVNTATNDVSGAQIGFVNTATQQPGKAQMGFVNTAVKAMDGAQLGFVNTVADSVHGAQIGYVNTAVGSVDGVQIGFANTAMGSVQGAQIGFANSASSSINAAQIGFVNTAAGDVTGAQLGFVNTAAGNVSGTQIGFVNVATKKLKGMQLGFINYTDSVEAGIPIGFLSIVRHGGYQALELSVSEYYPATIAFKIGVEKFYTSLFFGYNPSQSNQSDMSDFATGAGFGTFIPIKNNFFFNPELNFMLPINRYKSGNKTTDQTIMPEDIVEETETPREWYRQITSFAPYFGYNFNAHCSLAVAPTISWSSVNATFEDGTAYNEVAEPLFSIATHKINDKHSVVIGARAALRWRF
ncbi:MAG: hypothetical protein LBU90_10120 [Bacteroidales bacterium]|jgi:hypothetical protein|nr:hypothetical protein [Bacteroidales bacterium]